MNYHNFSLLEQPIPDLCADRIDYALREFPKNIFQYCIDKLINYDQKIIFSDKKSAEIFATNYLKRQEIHWAGFEAVSRYYLLAMALKIALKNKILKMDDFWTTDDQIINKLLLSKNIEISKILTLLKNKSLKYLLKSKKITHKKFRYVDPEYIDRNKVYILSQTDKKFAKVINETKQKNSLGVSLPVIN